MLTTVAARVRIVSISRCSANMRHYKPLENAGTSYAIPQVLPANQRAQCFT